MNVSLTRELEKFVEEQVEGGLYQTASEVVRAGLRLLKEETPDVRWTPRTLKELEAGLLQSVERFDPGEGISVAKSRQSIERKIKARKNRPIAR